MQPLGPEQRMSEPSAFLARHLLLATEMLIRNPDPSRCSAGAQRQKREQRGAVSIETLVLAGVLVLAAGVAVRAFSHSLERSFECTGGRIARWTDGTSLAAQACGTPPLVGTMAAASPLLPQRPERERSPASGGANSRRRSSGLELAGMTPATEVLDAPTAGAASANRPAPASQRGSRDPLMERHVVNSDGVIITDDPARIQMGIGHLSNVGTCPLIIHSRDAIGDVLDEIKPLLPGAIIEMYMPPPGTANVVVELDISNVSYPCEPGSRLVPDDAGIVEFDRVLK